MSALDKAFIKAYTKDPCPPATGSEDDSADLARSPYMDWYETAPAGSLQGPYGGEPVYRIDDAHDSPQGARLAPHAPLAPSPTYSDPAYGSPYRAPPSPDPLAAEDAWGACAAAAGPASAQPVGAIPATSPPAVLPPPTTLPTAVGPTATIAPPSAATAAGPAGGLPAAQAAPPDEVSEAVEPSRASKLQSLFSESAADEEAAQAFWPDWEVDRLVWPTLCERLLAAQERYFRSVGQRLKSATQDSHHVVMISGTRRGEGRTTLALCLARSAAQAGVSTALVDADLKNPQLGLRLGVETSCGWLAVGTDDTPLSEAAVASLEEGLTLFPLAGPENPEVAPGAPSRLAVLREIAEHFPLVIVDTGPLDSDGRHLFADGDECPIDTAIVLRDLRNTTERKALATAESLQRSGVPAVGIAENFCEMEAD
ncbi:MAG: hypothetical protein GX575_14495 [Candidatus Anammoximicrobium sp.]|nr:hypothetical protein [Candidatus Anammoximicrobium sp.]